MPCLISLHLPLPLLKSYIVIYHHFSICDCNLKGWAPPSLCSNQAHRNHSTESRPLFNHPSQLLLRGLCRETISMCKNGTTTASSACQPGPHPLGIYRAPSSDPIILPRSQNLSRPQVQPQLFTQSTKAAKKSLELRPPEGVPTPVHLSSLWPTHFPTNFLTNQAPPIIKVTHSA